MKINETTSIGIILGATAVVVGYLAYLDSSVFYSLIALMLLALAITNGKVMKAFRALISEEKRIQGSFVISLIVCIMIIMGISSLQGTGAQPIGLIGLLAIFGSICVGSFMKLKQRK